MCLPRYQPHYQYRQAVPKYALKTASIESYSTRDKPLQCRHDLPSAQSEYLHVKKIHVTEVQRTEAEETI